MIKFGIVPSAAPFTRNGSVFRPGDAVGDILPQLGQNAEILAQRLRERRGPVGKDLPISASIIRPVA